MTTPHGRVVIALLLMVLALSLMGCATSSPPPQVQPPAIPQPPAELMISPEPGLWLDSARQLFLNWRKLLTPANPA